MRVIDSIDDRQGTIDAALHARGLARRIGVTVPHLLSVPEIVARTDFVGVIRLVCHERNGAEPAHRWIRERIVEKTSSL